MTMTAMADRVDEPGAAKVSNVHAVPRSASGRAAVTKAGMAKVAAAAPAPRREARLGRWGRALAAAALPPLAGLALLVGLWHLATLKGGGIPSPGTTWAAALARGSTPIRSRAFITRRRTSARSSA